MNPSNTLTQRGGITPAGMGVVQPYTHTPVYKPAQQQLQTGVPVPELHTSPKYIVVGNGSAGHWCTWLTCIALVIIFVILGFILLYLATATV